MVDDRLRTDDDLGAEPQVRRSRRGASEVSGAQSGYALALTALLLVPLMAITAIAVDIGVWYLQAQKNQRIADAAALAGVVWLPDEAKAWDVAMEAVGRNGLEPGIDSSVNIEYLGRTELKVQVATKSELSFSRMFLNEFAITRSAVAAYNPPIAMGSPENQLGGPGQLMLGVSGACAGRENGDLRSAHYVDSYSGGVATCGGTSNPDFDWTGYTFSINVSQEWIDANPGQAVSIEAYDASYSPGMGNPHDLRLKAVTTDFDTFYELFDRGSNPNNLDWTDNIYWWNAPSRDASYQGQWRIVGSIASPQPGTYYLRVRSDWHPQSYGSNGFALRASRSGSFANCTTLSDPACIQVSAVGELPLFASLSGGFSDFWLAEVPDVNAGKDLKVTLFDAGEGAESIEILDPNGNPATFTWEVDCSVGPVATGGCSGGPTQLLDVSGTGGQVYASAFSQSKYNDRKVTLTIELPNNYATVYAGDWWKVRYRFGSSMTDRTTWSIQLVGDPIRLTG